MDESSGQEINVVISDMSLYPMSLRPKFTVDGFVSLNTAILIFTVNFHCINTCS